MEMIEKRVSTIEKIRAKIKERDYFLSSHAEEEMVEDRLERADVENVILKGRVQKKLTHEPVAQSFSSDLQYTAGHQTV